MRKYLLTALLAASVAMPAMAQEQDNGGRRYRDRSAGSEQPRQQRTERTVPPQRSERAEPQAGQRANWSERGQMRQRAVPQEQVRTQEPAFQQPELRQQGERRAWTERRQQRNDALRPRTVPPATQDGSTSDLQRYTRVRDGSGIRDGDRTRVRDGVTTRTLDQNRSSTWSSTNRTGTRYARTGGQWSNQWRTNRNYDWRRYRDNNRSLFRLGSYRDPYGSRYRRFSIGFSLFPSYYQSNYWLDDPYMYRLPQAYGPYRWVRYYGDALLVNIYTGQVVDVVYDFFW